jgi:outer membrane immunogenic protein
MFSWSGFYVGGNVGYGWGDGDGDIGFSGFGRGPIKGDGNGFLGGVQAGYNWQMGSWVVGVETDFQGSAAKGDVHGGPGGSRLNADYENPWFGTFRGRVGYGSDQLLGYVTGGVVYGESKLSGTVSGPAGGSFSSSETSTSWTVGVGVEYALWDRWSTKLEYLYVGTPGDIPVPPKTTTISGDTNSNIIRTGLNYRF